MTAFPIFNRLSTTDYGLYPGTKGQPDIDVTFAPGLTLVLGANGLGKTTLVTMLYRMCTGPFDIPGLAGSSELGTRSLEARKLSRSDCRLFAARVVDGAATATACLEMTLGTARVAVTRSLGSLDVTELSVDGDARPASDNAFQDLILEHAGLSSFGDWILILQHLTFYFENRRALVWDASAQRQILRILFLPHSTGLEWRRREREIVQRDSQMRNLQNALTREARDLTEVADLVDNRGVLRDELRVLEKLQAVDEARLASLDDQVLTEESARQAARLAALKAEADHEAAYRDLERRQLLAIGSAFPTTDDTSRYILGTLLSEDTCLACGNVATIAAAALRERQHDSRCVVCDTPIVPPEGTSSLTSRSISRATALLERAATQLDASNAERLAAEQAFDALIQEIQTLNTSTAQRAAHLDEIIKRLPPAEVELHQRRDELASLRGRVEHMKSELADQRSAFSDFIKGVNRSIARHKTQVQETFTGFADGFLLEMCTLVWSPRKTRLGEYGDQIDFPGFELDLGGASFASPVRREGPQQVSESQREFIDLAFRMTLMRTAGTDGVGTLVIDAPESSLDAVFVTRAADVLTRFAAPDSLSRLVITSNLVEGDLIPALINRAAIASASDSRIVDLLKLAAPTAATRTLHKEYAAVRRQLFKRAKSLRQ
jgi:hypothetical protein